MIRFGIARLPGAALALAASAVLALACPAQATRPEKEVDRLIINPSPDFRTTARLSEAQGIANLRALIPGSDYEEIWAFLPSEKKWVELGCCERQTQRGNYVGLDGHVLGLMAAYPNLTMYHIHTPSHFIRENYHENRRLLKEVEEALPSATDMATMIKLSRQHHKLHPKGRMIWRIVSRHGVTTYGLTPGALAGSEEISLKAFMFSVFDDEELTDPEEPVRDLVRLALKRLAKGPFVLEFQGLP
jgi:hypothetical protein